MALKPSTVLACWLATWFVILQLVAPPGMMPRAGADGFEISICTAQGLQQIFIETSEEDGEKKDKKNNAFSVFSLATLKSLSSAPLGAFILETARPKHVFAHNEVGHYAILRRSHAPRAPPVFV